MKVAEKIFVIFVAVVVAFVVGAIASLTLGKSSSFWWGVGLALVGSGLILIICFILNKTSLRKK